LHGEDGYFTSYELAFGYRLFTLPEIGGYKIKNDCGEVLIEAKSSNPYLKDLVYNCRKGGCSLALQVGMIFNLRQTRGGAVINPNLLNSVLRK